MGYGSSDYNSGYSSGKRAGRSEMESEIREAERKSVARVLAGNPHFQEGAKAAQRKLGRECGYISSYVDESKITIETNGFLHTGLFAAHADASQAPQVLADAEKLLKDKLLSENLALSDDDYAAGGVAFLGLQYGESEGEAPNSYKLGRGAEFVAGLTDEDYYNFGYMGRIANIAVTLGNVHSDGDWTKWLIGEEQENAAASPVQADKNYRKYLTDALQDLAAPVAEKVDALLKAGAPPYSSTAPNPVPA